MGGIIKYSGGKMNVEKSMNILAPVNYPWTFNGPRTSRHHIDRRLFVPFNKISAKIEGITVFNPLPFRKFDLIHAFNRIPLGNTPYIIGFESHLPRAFGMEKTSYFKRLAASLAGDRCRGIYAISEYAKRHFLQQHAQSPLIDILAKKLHVRYPNMPIPQTQDMFDGKMDTINLIFIGNHFVRKGGTAVLKLAELAQEQGIPLHIDIVSSLQVGQISWVDPLIENYFDSYQNLCGTLKNIKIHGSLPNHKVLELLKRAHFSLLPTFSDTFGFSAIESMANHVPVMAAAQGALPEFVIDKENGFLLPMETNDIGEWVHIGRNDRNSREYAELFNTESDRLATQMLSHLQQVMSSQSGYMAMRQNAYHKAKELFSADDATLFWDSIYDQSGNRLR